MENIVVFREGPELYTDSCLLEVVCRFLGANRDLKVLSFEVPSFSGNSRDLMHLAHAWLQQTLNNNGAAIVVPLSHPVAQLLALLAFNPSNLPVIRPSIELAIDGRSQAGFRCFQHILPTGEPKDLK